ncbi:MAG: hydroxyisourate hydrolase [Terracidiphilus sp.]|jgi:5-hydroxyisourate hydrolase
MSGITTHVLDAVLGKPAGGIAVRLERRENSEWMTVAETGTDADGRCRNLTSEAGAGTYRLTFATGDYLAAKGRNSLYPEISVVFACGGEDSYHLPLLLSDNSYTTYRGS